MNPSVTPNRVEMIGQTPKLPVLAGALALSLLIAIATAVTARAATSTPTIRLFPTTVVEDLRQTGNVARDMETGLQDVIGKLDQQQQLYQESKCEGAENDTGCQRLARQIGATYLDMLTIMEERLPDMEHTVNNTRVSLEKGLRNELGRKMTPWTLQETLLGKGSAPGDTTANAPTLRGRSGMRLVRTLQTVLSAGRHVRQPGRPVACGTGFGHLSRYGRNQHTYRKDAAGNRARDTDGTAQPVVRDYHARDDGSRRWRQVDPVR